MSCTILCARIFFRTEAIPAWSPPFPFVSSIHKDISERLPQFNRALYLQVKEVLEVNKAQRHIRGGIATRKKYRGT